MRRQFAIYTKQLHTVVTERLIELGNERATLHTYAMIAERLALNFNLRNDRLMGDKVFRNIGSNNQQNLIKKSMIFVYTFGEAFLASIVQSFIVVSSTHF